MVDELSTQNIGEIVYFNTTPKTRVLFGAAPSQFLLKATLQHHVKNNSDDKFADKFLSNIYVDNVYLTSNDENSLYD